MRKKVLIDLENIDYQRLADIIEGYLREGKYTQAEHIAEDIWNNDEYTDEDVIIMLITLGYIACLSQGVER